MKALLLIYTIGTLTDYWTTAWGLTRGAVESNQFAAAMYAEHGIEALLTFKLWGIVLFCSAAWLIPMTDRLVTKLCGGTCRVGHFMTFGAIWLVTLMQWLVVGSNFAWIRVAMALGY